MLNLLDDTPIVPGDTHPAFEGNEAARQVLNDAEDELRSWQPNLELIHSSAGALGVGAMPGGGMTGPAMSAYGIDEAEHPAYREKAGRSRSGSGEQRAVSASSLGSHDGGGEVRPPYPMTEAERREVAQAGVI